MLMVFFHHQPVVAAFAGSGVGCFRAIVDRGLQVGSAVDYGGPRCCVAVLVAAGCYCYVSGSVGYFRHPGSLSGSLTWDGSCFDNLHDCTR